MPADETERQGRDLADPPANGGQVRFPPAALAGEALEGSHLEGLETRPAAAADLTRLALQAGPV
jgi:hypothetical protein